MTRRPLLAAFGGAASPRVANQMSQRVETAGFDALWVPEGSQPVFSLCTAASLATSKLGLGTSVAVAFARSPMLTAQAAWMLAQATDGRFITGLGTQVRAHVERRYSAAFRPPGPRMREYVEALRAIYAAFRGEAPLKFDGEYYSFSLLTPTWSPGPMEFPDPPTYLAGVRPWMCEMIGAVGDGMLVHPLNSAAYLEEVVVPALRNGERIGNRAPGSVALVCPIMTAVSDDEAVIERQRSAIRARLAFYGSTPGYEVIFAASGWPGIGDELNALQRQGNFEAMQQIISDDMLDAFALTSTWEELPQKLLHRFGAIADQIVCYSVIEQWDDDPDSLGRWQEVNHRFRELVAHG